MCAIASVMECTGIPDNATMGIPEGIPGHIIPKRIRQALRVGGKKWIAQVAAGVVVGASM